MNTDSMNRCDLCKHWVYEWPDDMGVCTHPEGPGDGKGFGVPIAQAALSKRLKQRHAGRTATSCDTRCARWESDGTPRADQARAAIAKAQP